MTAAVQSMLGNIGGIQAIYKWKDLGRDDGHFNTLLQNRLKRGTVKSQTHGIKSFLDFFYNVVMIYTTFLHVL